MNRRFKWKTDFDKQVIIENFQNRGWIKCSEKDDDEWNVYWATVWNVRNIFNPKSGIRLNDQQIINHFPNHYELTRKDLMVKNFKRYRKTLEKDGLISQLKDSEGNPLQLDFIPQTYILPGEYSLFTEEFHRNPNITWIVKPAARSQGQGIFLLRKINQLKKIADNKNQFNLNMKENYVVSRYIENPFLVGGKKFDMRVYCLVTSYKPLKVWLYKAGFGRFCNEKYTTDIAEMDNMYIHLTNVAIQKYSDKYSNVHGGKWSIQNLRYYMEMIFGSQTAEKCFEEIKNIMVQTLKSVQSVIINDKHCFEMYGYDILIDDQCKPWLIEINASPSLSTTTKVDLELKMGLINDTYKIVIPDNWSEEGQKLGTNSCTATQVGGFSIIYDEAEEKKAEMLKQNPKQNSNQRTWK